MDSGIQWCVSGGSSVVDKWTTLVGDVGNGRDSDTDCGQGRGA